MIMNRQAALKERQINEIESPGFREFSHSKEPAVQKLLDTIAVIIANEYIEKVKNNPELFSDGGIM
jgi:hypothetical protein